MIRSIPELPELASSRSGILEIAVAAPRISSTFEALDRARSDGFARYSVFGDIASAVEAVQLGYCNALMKGEIETAEFMSAVIKGGPAICGGERLSVIGFYDPPVYHKVIAVTDFGVNIAPDAAQKMEIITSAVRLFHNMGIECPKVALLSDTDKFSARTPASADAALILAGKSELPECEIAGPVSMDLAVSKEAAADKGRHSAVYGDADLLVVPDIVAGNILVKTITLWAGSHTAGTILGTKIPVIMTSRSAPADDKYYSIALAALRLDPETAS